MTAQLFAPVGATPVEYLVPRQWTAPHVERRLVEALECVMAMEEQGGPEEFGSAWPGYADDWAVEVAAANAYWAGTGTADQIARGRQMGIAEVKRLIREARDVAATKVDPPTMEAITRMEIAIGWPGRYLVGHQLEWMLPAVQRVVAAKATGHDCEWLAATIGGPTAETWQSRATFGCDRIAIGLTRDRVAVF